MQRRMPLGQFIIETQRRSAELAATRAGAPVPPTGQPTGDFSELLLDVVTAIKQIAHAVNKGAITNSLGSAGATNVQGETQKKLDVVANDLMIRAVEWGGHLAGMVSEEVDDVIAIADRYPRGKYLLVFDPLDGSSNVDLNMSVGTIFSILRAPEAGVHPTAEAFLQAGARQVCAGYAVYGSSTMLVLTTGNGVHGFTLDREIGEFLLTHPDLLITSASKEFAINASNRRFWEPPVRRYVEECLAGVEGPRGKDFNMRWIASLVAEVHRILIRGGVFMYPRDTKEPRMPGRLRLLYEASPMAMIVEQAGGAASTGDARILDLQPESLHQRVPVILGSADEVARIERYYREWTPTDAAPTTSTSTTDGAAT